MTRRPHRRLAAAALAPVLALTACSGTAADSATSGTSLTPVTVVLDWTPNTNHTGLYVADAQGWFAEAGLDVDIVLPPEDGAESLVAAGKADFGVSYQENLTLARTQDVPIVSVAAVIAHNTSAFASPADRGITRPAQYAGRTYGGWGSEVEQAVLRTIVEADGGDPDDVSVTDIGASDLYGAFARGIDLAWVYPHWDGPVAQARGEELNVQLVRDYDDALDYYTPVLATSEATIAERPDVVEAFIGAVARGYGFAAEDPAAAADILLAANPDLDAEQVRASQALVSPLYQDDSPEWGYQRPTVWTSFSRWLEGNGIIEPGFDESAAYTNAFVETGPAE